MRESITGSWEFTIIIIFVLMFTAYLTVAISYYKTFKCKNDVISIIEKKEGINSKSITTINNYLIANNYGSKGRCDAGYYGATSLQSTGNLEYVSDGDTTKYYYCIQKTSGYSREKPGRSYYDVKLFFSLSLPVIGDIIDFDATGTTMEMDVVYDDF